MNPPEHDRPETHRVSLPTRRDVLGFTAAAAAGLAMCAICTSDADAATSAPTKGEVDAGPASTFKADGVYDALARSHRVLIVNAKGTLHASSAMCTHKNAMLTKDAKGEGPIRCPKHNSVFDADGIPISGPAKTSLPRYAIRIDERGHVRVDTSKSFDERDWKDAAASVALPA